MTAVFARAGRFEGRTAAQTLWSGGKQRQRRKGWLHCGTSSLQCAGYGDGSLRGSAASAFWASNDGRKVGGREQSARVNISRPYNAELAAIEEDIDAATEDAGDYPGAGSPTDRDIGQRLPTEDDPDSMWERFAQHENHGDKHEDLRFVGSPLEVDYKTSLAEAIQNGADDAIIRSILAAETANDAGFIASLHDTTFTKILEVLQPAHVFGKLLSTHMQCSPVTIRQFGALPMRHIARGSHKIITNITAMRRRGGGTLTLEHFVILLRSARDIGSVKMSTSFWSSMRALGHSPTTECWNYYLSAKLFDRMNGSANTHKMRVIPFNMSARQTPILNREYASYRTGQDGVKEWMTKEFNKMLRDKTTADEESYRILMTAAAREGDMSTVETVLRKVWDIDVKSLAKGAPEEDIIPKPMPKSSPKYPTNKLLSTVAHAFAINNDIPLAIRLVDFIARHFDIKISAETWSQLFEWTYVLSVSRTGTARPNRIGQLPDQSLMDLWNTMTSPFYAITPTIPMYSHLICNLGRRSMLTAMLSQMTEARHLHSTHRATLSTLQTNYRTAILSHEREAKLSTNLHPLRRDYEEHLLLHRHTHFLTRRWLRRLLYTMRNRALSDASGDSCYRTLPRVLWEWRDAAPATAVYNISGGIVEIRLRTDEEVDRVNAGIIEEEAEARSWAERAERVIGFEGVVVRRELGNLLGVEMRPGEGRVDVGWWAQSDLAPSAGSRKRSEVAEGDEDAVQDVGPEVMLRPLGT